MTLFSVPPKFAIAVLSAFTFALGAQAAIIDLFDDAQFLSVSGTPPNSVQGSINGTNMIGGTRDVRLDLISNPLGVSLELGTDIGGNGLMTFAQGPGTRGTALIVWDGNLGFPLDPVGLGGVDITDSGNSDRFQIRVILAEAITNLTFTVYDASTTIGYSQTVSSPIVPFGSPIDLIVPFSSFGTAPPGLFTNVGAITLLVDPSVATSDFAADFFVTIPEPGSTTLLGLVGVGACGVWIRRRRIRHQACLQR